MKVETLEKLCKKEFKKIEELSSGEDLIEVKDKGCSISCNYLYKIPSEKNTNNETFQAYAKIMFDESFQKINGEEGAQICNLNVHPLLRGNGYGTKLVETVESIFRQRGWNKVDVKNVYNSSFWMKMGYRPKKVKKLKDEFEYYTKDLN